MTSIVEHQVKLNLSQEKAWQIMQDLTQPHRYVPGLIDCKMHEGNTQGVGASRRVFKKMMQLDETVTEWKEGEGFTLKLHFESKDKPLPNAFFRYELKPINDQQCFFIATMGYDFWLGKIGQVINQLLVLPFVKKEIRDVAYALKHFYEFSETPTAADIKRLRYLS